MIPNPYNSKHAQKNDKDNIIDLPPQSQVKILHRWDGCRPNIRYMLDGHWTYLIQKSNDEALARLLQEQKRIRFETRHPNPYQLDRIESLYNKPLDDFREYCTTFILVPYFTNIKKKSYSGTFDLVVDWLYICRSKKRLNWDPKWKVKYVLELEHIHYRFQNLFIYSLSTYRISQHVRSGHVVCPEEHYCINFWSPRSYFYIN